MIGLVMGVPSLLEIFDEKYYLNLEGGILEALGRMFKSGLKLYVYPKIDEETGELVTATKLEVAPNLRSLYQYLLENEFIQEITDYNPEFLRIHPSRNAGQIAVRRPELGVDGAAGSRRMIKDRQFFGYRLRRELSGHFGGRSAWNHRLAAGRKPRVSARFRL